jgi:hypothetical protein
LAGIKIETKMMPFRLGFFNSTERSGRNEMSLTTLGVVTAPKGDDDCDPKREKRLGFFIF